ncbi:unnamed protein product, partial [Mesorhabditis belari]
SGVASPDDDSHLRFADFTELVSIGFGSIQFRVLVLFAVGCRLSLVILNQEELVESICNLLQFDGRIQDEKLRQYKEHNDGTMCAKLLAINRKPERTDEEERMTTVLQACLGYSKYSYSWRSLKGTKFHEAHGKKYHFGSFKQGDVLGCLLHLPHDNIHPSRSSSDYLPVTHKDVETAGEPNKAETGVIESRKDSKDDTVPGAEQQVHCESRKDSTGSRHGRSDKLRNEYRHLSKWCPEGMTYDAFKANQGAQPRRNRYQDVPCGDARRVVIKFPGAPCEYIHANFVKTPQAENRFICTQGPLENTVVDFCCFPIWIVKVVVVTALIENRTSPPAGLTPRKDELNHTTRVDAKRRTKKSLCDFHCITDGRTSVRTWRRLLQIPCNRRDHRKSRGYALLKENVLGK